MADLDFSDLIPKQQLSGDTPQGSPDLSFDDLVPKKPSAGDYLTGMAKAQGQRLVDMGKGAWQGADEATQEFKKDFTTPVDEEEYIPHHEGLMGEIEAPFRQAAGSLAGYGLRAAKTALDLGGIPFGAAAGATAPLTVDPLTSVYKAAGLPDKEAREAAERTNSDLINIPAFAMGHGEAKAPVEMPKSATTQAGETVLGNIAHGKPGDAPPEPQATTEPSQPTPPQPQPATAQPQAEQKQQQQQPGPYSPYFDLESGNYGVRGPNGIDHAPVFKTPEEAEAKADQANQTSQKFDQIVAAGQKPQNPFADLIPQPEPKPEARNVAPAESPLAPVPISNANVKGEVPRVRFDRDAAAIQNALPDPADGMTRLWRGNRPGEVGQNPQFTNDLAGIALPFREGYGGDLSYVDVPTDDLAQYESKGAVAPGAEFIVPPDVAKGAKVVDAAPGGFEAAPARSTSPVNNPYEMVDPRDLKVDPERFQYKTSDERGVTGALTGGSKWEPSLANPITLWEDENGDRYVVNGHQRTDLALRAQAAGQEGVMMPARIFKAEDGFTPEQMRVLGAAQNIAEGSGTALDAARVLRGVDSDINGMTIPELPPRSALVQDARGLANLSDQAFGMVENEVLPAEFAAEVGRKITDPNQQLAALDALAKHPPQNAAQARFMVQDILNSGFLEGEQTNLFGTEAFAQTLIAERAKILDNAMRTLRKAKSVFGSAASGEETLAGAGNVMNREANLRGKTDNEQLIARLQADATRKGELSDTLSRYARELADGKPVASVTSRFLADARKLERGAEEGVPSGADLGGEGLAGEDEGQAGLAFSRRGVGGMPQLQAALRSGNVKRGANAIIDRLRLQNGLDESYNRRNPDNARMPVDRADIREVEDFIHFIGHHMFDGVGLRILKGEGGPLGAYDAVSKTVAIFRKAIEHGELTRTAVHELWHSLERVLPPEDRVAVTREFQKQQGKWLKANEWARPFLRNGEIQDSLIGKAAREWVDKFGDDAGDNVKVLRNNKGEPVAVRLKWTEENYRFKNRAEYFAETMADKYFDARDIEDARARSVFGHIRDIYQRMVAGVKRLFGADQTGRIFEGFRNGDYDPTTGDWRLGSDTGDIYEAGKSGEPTTEKTAQGEQFVMPGAEQSAKQAAQARGETLRGKGPQKAADEGLFAPKEPAQGSLFDVEKEKRAEAAPGLADSVRHYADRAKGFIADVSQNLKMAAAPMAAGSKTAQAIAKDFANSMREARWIGSRQISTLTKSFTPDELRNMWEAADEQSVAMQKGESTSGIGLDRLTTKERLGLEAVRRDADETYAQAQDLGIAPKEALPSYVPRMVVDIGQEGVRRPSSGGEPLALDRIGRNLKTTTPQMKGRNYLETGETEAAARAKFGDDATVVRDIRTLPLATTRLKEAIAGKTLINQIKEIGKQAGEDTVSVGGEPEGSEHHWFTMDHPAFKEWRPKFQTDPETGKVTPILDAQGNTVFERVPIYVRDDFEGPLRAVLSTEQGKIYGALMDMKAKTMGLIMYSPLIHNAVEWGRALPAMPGKVATFRVYFDGYKAKNDPATMREAIRAGLSPIGGHGAVQDITSIAAGANLTPGRSWTAKLASYIPGLFDPRAGEAVKQWVDKAGNFWHNTLLWDRVGDLQMGLYVNLRDQKIAAGMDPLTAQRYAAHFANRYAGALPIEAMSTAARKIANLVLFSRSFTLGNLGAMKDMVAGLPSDVQAQILRDSGTKALEGVQSVAKRKAIATIALDVGLMYVGNSILQSSLAVLSGNSSLDEEAQGYARRMSALFERAKENPLDVMNPFKDINSLTPMGENEPGKQDRILVGYAKDGTAIYMRNPVGKIGEEFTGWLTEPLTMLTKKLGTIARPTLQVASNDKGFGRHVYDPYADTPSAWIKNIGRIVSLYMGDQIPLQSVQAAKDLLAGRGDQATNAAQVFGPLAGVTFSKGAPGGPAVGQLYQAEDQHKFNVSEQLPGIRQKISDGDLKGAIADMRALGIPSQLQMFYIKTTLHPQTRLTQRALREFQQYATPEQKEGLAHAMEERPQHKVGGRVPHPEPTEAQIAAGNYRKGHVSFQGLRLAVETDKGAVRKGVGADGKPWRVTMPAPYGYVKGTEGADGDHVDAYIGPDEKSDRVFLIDQLDADTGRFDEHKTMLGYPNMTAALADYRRSFSDGKADRRIGNVRCMSVGEFKNWLRKHDTTKPIATA